MSGVFQANADKVVIGMVHVGPLPGTPFHVPGSLEVIRCNAVADAIALKSGGADGCLIQTVDRVYDVSDNCDPLRLAAMTLIAADVVHATGDNFAVGVQIMKNALSASFAVAKISGASFIRASAWVGVTTSPHGTVRAEPDCVARYRSGIGADDIQVVADIHTQHFRWQGSDVAINRVAHWAMEAGANAVCLGEKSREVTTALAQEIRDTMPDTPIILPGFTNPENANAFLSISDGVFVGGCLKDTTSGRTDVRRVRRYIKAVRQEK